MVMDRRFQIIFLFLLLPVAAGATEGDDQASSETVPEWKKPYVELQVDGVAGGTHGTWRAGFNVMFAGGGDGFHVAAVAPIRFDSDGFRRREWDETNDYGRVLAMLGYRNESGDIDVAVRNVESFSLGAGNLVSMFNGTIDTDHWRTGLSARLHWDMAGGDLFIDAITGPSVFGARAYLRPLWFVDRNGQVGRLEVGASFATDLFSPGTMGSSTASAPSDILPDRHGLVSSDSDTLTAWSIDLRWPVRAAGPFELVPWTAWSRLGVADAFHAGLELSFLLPEKTGLSVSGEYQYMEKGFAAGYFDNVYMADRYDFAAWHEVVPGAVSKRAFINSAGVSRHGGSVGIALRRDPWFAAWFRADVDEFGYFSRYRAGFTVTVPERMLLTATVHARGFGAKNSASVPDRVFSRLAADVTVWKFIGVFASYSYELYVPESGDDMGRYVGGHAGMVGVRMTFGLLGDKSGKKDSGKK